MGLEEKSKEELIEYIRKIKNNPKVGLVWDKETEETKEKIVSDCDKNIPVLKEIKEKDIDNGGLNHILIEGDNFHALSVLNYTHNGMIDVIYIDPPYNTGNDKEFMYNDKWVNNEDLYRHSKWLNFMEKRLRLAQNLLKENGIIFISIDDNEYARLKLLCDKIFGENSFISTLIIETSAIAGHRRVPAINGSIVKTAEYVLVYCNGMDSKIIKNPMYDFIPGYDKHYSIFWDRNEDKTIKLMEYIKNNDEISKEFKSNNMQLSLDNLGILVGFNEKVRKWIYSDEISECIFRKGDEIKNINELRISKKKKGIIVTEDGKRIIKWKNGKYYTLFRYKDRIGKCDDYFLNYGERSIRGTLWKGFSSDGGNLNKEGGVSFKNGKKPKRLIKQPIKSVIKEGKSATILDFFAGSGTTGESVMELNEEGQNNYRFILCTNNENNICIEKTYPRMCNVLRGYGKNKPKEGSLKYYKTDFVKNEGTRDQKMYNLTQKCIPMLCKKNDTYETVISTDEYIIYSNKDKSKYTAIYFELDNGSASKIEFIENLKKIGEKKSLYIFSFSNNIEERLDDVENYEIEPIPQKIYNYYMQVVNISEEEN